MYPDNQTIEEKENMNFVLWLIQGQIASFTKFNIPQSEFEDLVKIFSSRKECKKTEYATGLSVYVNYELIIGDVHFLIHYNQGTDLGTFVYTNMEYFQS